jgi:hypothetical protein
MRIKNTLVVMECQEENCLEENYLCLGDGLQNYREKKEMSFQMRGIAYNCYLLLYHTCSGSENGDKNSF